MTSRRRFRNRVIKEVLRFELVLTFIPVEAILKLIESIHNMNMQQFLKQLLWVFLVVCCYLLFPARCENSIWKFGGKISLLREEWFGFPKLWAVGTIDDGHSQSCPVLPDKSRAIAAWSGHTANIFRARSSPWLIPVAVVEWRGLTHSGPSSRGATTPTSDPTSSIYKRQILNYILPTQT